MTRAKRIIAIQMFVQGVLESLQNLQERALLLGLTGSDATDLEFAGACDDIEHDAESLQALAAGAFVDEPHLRNLID